MHAFGVDNLRDLIFGFDVFISYDFDEGGAYATALKKSLEGQFPPLRCFLDRENFHIGDELNKTSRRRLNMSRHLAVILTPGVGEPASWVPRELQLFTADGSKNRDRILPLNVDESLETFPQDAKIRKYIPLAKGPDGGDSLLFHPIPADEFSSGEPSETTLKRIRELVADRRVDERRLRFFQALGTAMTVLFALAAGLYLYSESQRRQLAGAFSQAAFRNGAAMLEAGKLQEAIANFTAALDSDPENAAAADRLYSLISQGPSPWLQMRTLGFDVDITASSVAADGSRFAVALVDGQILLGDWKAEAQVLSVDQCGYKGNHPAKLIFHPDGKSLIAIVPGGALCVWDMASPRPVKVRPGIGTVSAIAVNKDSTFIALASDDGKVTLVSLGDDPDRTLPSQGVYTEMRLLPGDGGLVAANQAGVIHWKIDDGDVKTVLDIEPPPDEYWQTRDSFDELSPDGAWYSELRRDFGDFQAMQFPRDLISIGATGGDAIWGGQIQPDDLDRISQTTFDPTSSHFALTLSDGTVKISHRSGGATKINHEGATRSGFSTSGDLVYTVGNETRFWSSVDGSEALNPFPTRGDFEIDSLFKNKGRWFAVAQDARSISLWSASAHPEALALEDWPLKSDPQFRRRAALDGARRLLPTQDGNWKVIDNIDNEHPVAQLAYPLSGQSQDQADGQIEWFPSSNVAIVLDAAISADGKTIVTVAGELPPAVWSVGEAEPHRFLGEKDFPGRYAGETYLDREGSQALIEYPGDLRNGLVPSYAMYALDDGRLVAARLLSGQEAILNVSHDNQLIVASNPTSVRGAKDGRVIGAPMISSAKTCGAAFGDDDRSLVIVSADKKMQVHDLETGLLIAGPVPFEDAIDPQYCQPTPWFSKNDQQINLLVQQERDGTRSTRLLTWKFRLNMSTAERLQLAEFARLYYGVRLSSAGAVETLPPVTASELRARFVGSPDAGISKLFDRLLPVELPETAQ
jgi:hypothetical protein